MWPTSRWQEGDIFADPYRVWVESGSAVAPTRLQITADVIGSTAFDSQGNEIPLVVVGEAQLIGDNQSPELVGPLNISFAEGIVLLGGETAVNGSQLEVMLWWQASERPQGDYTVFVQLLDSEGTYLAGADAPPVNGDYPTRLWQDGDIIDDLHIFPDISAYPAGEYQLAIGFYDPVTGGRLPRLEGGDAVILPANLP